MITKGDLVRIPQNTYIEIVKPHKWYQKTRKPEIGIVISVDESRCTVLLNEEEWLIKSKDLQLCGDSGVYKAS